MKKEYLDNFLTDVEKEKLSAFIEDEQMFEAVKKVLLFSIYNSGVLTKGKPHDAMHNFALVMAADGKINNEQLGEYTRAAYQGINALENGLNDLKMYKLEKMPDLRKNPAR